MTDDGGSMQTVDEKVWHVWAKAKDQLISAARLLPSDTPKMDLAGSSFEDLIDYNALELAWEELDRVATGSIFCPITLKNSSSVDPKTIKDAVEFWHHMALAGKYLFA